MGFSLPPRLLASLFKSDLYRARGRTGAGRPAVVNCGGIYRQVQTGDRLRLDGARGLVEVLARRSGGGEKPA